MFVEHRLAVIGRRGGQGRILFEHQPIEQVFHVLAVECVVGGLAHPLVGERALDEIELVRPVVGINPRDDLHAGGFQPVDRVGRRRLDPVDLAG